MGASPCSTTQRKACPYNHTVATRGTQQDLLPLRFSEKIATEMNVLYAPFNNTYYLERDEEQLHALKEAIKSKSI